ncbi:MAG: GntR family transcriptional regulator [Victivallales bacterium]|nr:GntR family transcriptional regulator [Victivallales bacterium]
MNLPERAREMVQFLEDRLVTGAVAKGSPLPSLRALMARFKLSYGTCRRGMRYLQERHPEIRFEKGRGTYLENEQGRPVSRQRWMAVLHYPGELTSGLYYTTLKGVISAAERDGVEVRQIPYDPTNSGLNIQELTDGAMGAILLWEYDSFFQDLQLAIPAVGVMMNNSFRDTISLVDINPYSGAEQLVEYFLSRGVRQVRILSHRFDIFMQRARIFALLARERGLPCTLQKGGVRKYHANTGYFFTSDHVANVACETYHRQMGGDLPTEHVIAGFDGKQFLVPEFYRFPTIAVNWELIGLTAYGEIMQRFNNPVLPGRRIYLSGWLSLPEEQNTGG